MILDLTNLEKSLIKYKISKFPDGQQTLDLVDVRVALLIDKTIQIYLDFF